MKKIITVLAIALTMSASAQNLSSIPKCENCAKSQYVLKHVWQCGKLGGQTFMTYHFDDGVYKMNVALTILNKILSDNNLDFFDPDIEDTYLRSLVTDWSDYSMLDITIRTGDSYVSKVWEIPTNSGKTIIFFQMNEEKRAIVIVKE